ncbi:MAG TPA: hypothetical protein VFB63_00845, partial [Bryobacteraceae bacterium]|nr:hypothetical protein [Bryobacteraceae bacterium]
RRILFGGTQSPWNDPAYQGSVSYDRGICPVVERMHDEEVIFTNAIHAQTGESDVADIGRAFHKVIDCFRSAGA